MAKSPWEIDRSRLQAPTVQALDALSNSQLAPLVHSVGGYENRNIAGTNTLSNHAKGLALDLGVTPRGQDGWAVAGTAASLPGAKAVIYNGMIASADKGWAWRTYHHPGGTYSPTLNHEDHVHVDFSGAPMAVGMAPASHPPSVGAPQPQGGLLVESLMATIRARETGGGDPAGRNIPTGLKGSASGYYQFTDSTWRASAKAAGVGTEYARAIQAPKEVQDAVARASILKILQRSGGDPGAVPRVWYTGHNTTGTAEDNQVPRADYGNRITPAQYSANWLKDFRKISGQQGAAGLGAGVGLDTQAIGRGAALRLQQMGKDLAKYDLQIENGQVYAVPNGK